MLTRFSAKQGLKLGTALTGFGIMLPTPAFADCLINATNTTVTCSTADTNGFQSSFNLLTINVLPGVNVTGRPFLGGPDSLGGQPERRQQ